MCSPSFIAMMFSVRDLAVLRDRDGCRDLPEELDPSHAVGTSADPRDTAVVIYRKNSIQEIRSAPSAVGNTLTRFAYPDRSR